MRCLVHQKKAGRNTRTPSNDDSNFVLEHLYPMQDDDRGHQEKKNQKVDGAINKIGRITEQNQWSQEVNKTTANDSQETIATGRTVVGTTPPKYANLKAGETQWVKTRKWDKSGGITDATIREIRKAIDDEFNDKVRRFMVNNYSGL